MNVLNKLTVQSLRKNKKRTLATIFGIILSTALICAAAGLVTSVQKTELEAAKKEEGNYHVGFPNVQKENLKYIKENRNVKDFYCIERTGYAILPESQNPDKPYLYLMALDEKALEYAGLTLIEGRLPQSNTELVLTQTVQSNAGVTVHVGDVLPLSVGKRISEGYELWQENPYLDEESEKEQLKEIFHQDYTVVGIMKRPNYNTLEPYSSPGYSAITKMDTANAANTTQETIDIYVNFTNIQKTNQYALQIKDVLEKYQDWNEEPVYNRELLRWSGSMIGDSTRTLLLGVGSTVIAIIIISSIFVIQNSFSISITERMRQYGMLASVGATSKQIRKNVLFEGIVLGIIGIPLGILSGILAVFVLLQIVNYLIIDYMGRPLLYYLPLMPIMIAIMLSIITIYLSASSSARKASKISPMEAIRSNQDIKITAKKVKSWKIIKTLFGVGGEIAYKNLKRNRKKYQTTVISMVVSIVLFLSMYSFISYGFEYSSAVYSTLGYNLSVSLFYRGDVKEEYKIYQTISNLEGDNLYSITRFNQDYYLSADQYVSEFGKSLLKEQFDYQTTAGEETNSTNTDTNHTTLPEYKRSRMYLLSLGDAEYERYLTSLGIKTSDDYGAILVKAQYYYHDNKKVLEDFYTIKEGDTIQAASDSGETVSLNILKITSEHSMGSQHRNPTQDFFIISDRLMEKLGYISAGLKINAADSYETEKNITEKLQELCIANEQLTDYSITNLEEQARQENSFILVIKIFLYGFITVITLIGVTNIFNTITTNMNLREKEFAMLRSVGMTQREFSGMIRMESIFYGAKALFIGIPIGTACSFLFFKMFDNNMTTKFLIPWKAYLMVILFVLLIVGLTMQYSFGKIKNKNIIEAIRKDTI